MCLFEYIRVASVNLVVGGFVKAAKRKVGRMAVVNWRQLEKSLKTRNQLLK